MGPPKAWTFLATWINYERFKLLAFVFSKMIHSSAHLFLWLLGTFNAERSLFAHWFMHISTNGSSLSLWSTHETIILIFSQIVFSPVDFRLVWGQKQVLYIYYLYQIEYMHIGVHLSQTKIVWNSSELLWNSKILKFL